MLCVVLFATYAFLGCFVNQVKQPAVIYVISFWLLRYANSIPPLKSIFFLFEEIKSGNSYICIIGKIYWHGESIFYLILHLVLNSHAIHSYKIRSFWIEISVKLCKWVGYYSYVMCCVLTGWRKCMEMGYCSCRFRRIRQDFFFLFNYAINTVYFNKFEL